MTLWEHLFGHGVALRHHGHLAGTGAYATHAEIEFDYQAALEAIVGGGTEAGANFECTAFLVPERKDEDAADFVAIHISGYKVGYLNHENGERYREFLASADLSGFASCDGLIAGGWKREEGEGYFQVQLDLEWPLRLQEEVPLETAP
jgi:hypothetical protein